METVAEIYDMKSTVPTPRMLSMRDILGEFLADGEERYKARQEGRSFGVSTGFGSLDNELGGALAPGLHILHGAPGTGKTAFGLQMACNYNGPAIYISCEIPPLALFWRILSRVTNTFFGKFRSGELSPGELMALAQRGIQSVPNFAIMDATQAAASAVYIRDVCSQRQTDFPEDPLFVVVDSLHSWALALPTDAAEYERLQAALKAFKQISSELSCPILVIAERNRSKMQEGGQNAAAGSRLFEYISETVMSLDEDTNTVEPREGVKPLTLTLAKNRHGEQGKQLPLTFEGRLQRLEEPV